MGHSYVSSLYHCVFSTHGRTPIISAELELQLWPYLAGIAHQKEMKALAVGGVADHIHILLSLPSVLPVSKAMQFVKAGSSKWINDTFRSLRQFNWQEGYGAFSIGISQVPETIDYIRNQPAHHLKKTFQEEFESFLKAHGIDFDPRFHLG